MTDAESAENKYLDHVGRRLTSMLKLVKAAKNVVKPVQHALAEAIEAFKFSRAARKEKLNARACWLNLFDAEHEVAQQPPKINQTARSTDSMATDSPKLLSLIEEVTTLKAEIGKVSSIVSQLASSSLAGIQFSSEVKHGATMKKPKNTKKVIGPGPMHSVQSGERDRKVKVAVTNESDASATLDYSPDAATETVSETGWVTVRGMRKKRRTTPSTCQSAPGDGRKNTKALIQNRRPKVEAITISNPKTGSSSADVMKKVMADVNLGDMDVDVLRTRRTKTGAILVEVQDKNKADLLAERLKAAVGDQASVSRPMRLTKVLVVNVADWLEEDAVVNDIRRADDGLSP